MTKEVSLKIKIDGKELDLATTSVNQFNQAYSDASKRLNDLPLGSPEWKTLNSELGSAQKAFEQTKEIAGSAEGKFKSLRLQIRQTTVALQEAEEKGDIKTFNRLKNELDDLNDKLEITQLKSMKFVDALATLPGALGFVGQSIQGLDKGLKLLAANPWIAILSAAVGTLVALFKGLKESLSRTEEGQAKLAKVAELFERILNGIFAILEPLANMFIDFAINILGSKDAMQGLGKVVSVVAGVLAGAFQIVKTLTMFVVNNFITAFKTATGVLSGFGDVIAGVFTFDLGRVKRGVNQVKDTVVKGFNDTKDNIVNTAKGFVDVVDAYQKAYEQAEKSFNEGIKRRVGKSKQSAEDIKKLKQEEINAEYNLQKAKDELAEAQRKKDQDRVKELQNQQAFLKKRYDADVARIEALLKLEKKDTNEYKALQAQKLDIEKNYTTSSEALAKQLLDAKKKAYEQDVYNFTEAQKQIERERNRANTNEKNALDQKFAEGKLSQMQYNFSVSELNKIQAQRNLENIASDKQKEKAFFDQKYAEGLLDEETYNKNIDTLNSQYRDKEFVAQQAFGQSQVDQSKLIAQTLLETKQFEKDALIGLEQAKIDGIATIGGLLQQIAGENKALAITGLLIEQGAAIADILTKSARTKADLIGKKAMYAALIPNPITAAIGTAGVAATTAGLAANTIGTIASIASVAAAIGTGIAQISGKGSGGGKSGGEGGQNLGRNYEKGGLIGGRRHAQGGTMIEAEAGEAIMTRGAVTMFKPMLSMMNQMGGGVAFNSNIVTRPDAPSVANPAMDKSPVIMKTYVVENELTTEQQKQARLKELSTL